MSAEVTFPAQIGEDAIVNSWFAGWPYPNSTACICSAPQHVLQGWYRLESKAERESTM
jgi:hypothetical protein